MVRVSEVNLIECPDCKRTVLDDVKYCRFCGHDFNEVIDESEGKLKRFLKNPLKGVVSENVRYCVSCKNEIRDFSSDFCENCGELIPYYGEKIFCNCGSVKYDDLCNVCRSRGSKKRLTAEEFYKMWHNEVIVPLSKKYGKDLSKDNFKSHFKLSNEETNHIMYKIIYSMLFDKIDDNIVEFFKNILKETRENYKDLEKALLNTLEKNIKEMFDNEGYSTFNTTTLKAAYTETIETPYIKNKHGTGTKVLATAVAGPLGFVATSGVKQETQSKQVHHKGEYFHSKIILTNRNVSYLTYTDQTAGGFNDSRNDINKVVIDWKDINEFDDNEYFILNNGEAFKCPNWILTEFTKQNILETMGTINEELNNKLTNKYYSFGKESAKNIIIKLIKELIKSNEIKKPAKNSILELDALEKIISMYKEGLLTDEEFATMKKKFIEDSIEPTKKFCKSCGAEIIEDSNFCIQCGTKID